MTRPRRQGEGSLSDAIREALLHEPGLRLYRNNQGITRSRGRVYHAGLGNGSADLIGVLAVRLRGFSSLAFDGCAEQHAGITVGRFVALEVKMPGKVPTAEDISAAKRASMRTPWKDLDADTRRLLDQEAFLADVRAVGGFACYVDSPEAARAAIARARHGAAS